MKPMISTFPVNVSAPKFQLFQKVQYESSNPKRGAVEAIISGLSYVDFHTALIEDTGYIGWRYELSHVLGKSESELLMLDADTTTLVYEDEITAVEV